MPDDTELVASRLPRELVDFARKVGRGNVSAGIRDALEYLAQRHNTKPTQSQINDAIRTLADVQDGEATP
jgi:hypothetical protein